MLDAAAVVIFLCNVQPSTLAAHVWSLIVHVCVNLFCPFLLPLDRREDWLQPVFGLVTTRWLHSNPRIILDLLKSSSNLLKSPSNLLKSLAIMATMELCNVRTTIAVLMENRGTEMSTPPLTWLHCSSTPWPMEFNTDLRLSNDSLHLVPLPHHLPSRGLLPGS